MEKLNKQELIEQIAEEALLSKRDARESVECCFALIEKALLDGKEVNITNFGVFTPKTKKGRIGTDPATHQKIEIKSKNTVVFRPSKTLKDKIN